MQLLDKMLVYPGWKGSQEQLLLMTLINQMKFILTQLDFQLLRIIEKPFSKDPEE